jgi:hypothetical protein
MLALRGGNVRIAELAERRRISSTISPVSMASQRVLEHENPTGGKCAGSGIPGSATESRKVAQAKNSKRVKGGKGAKSAKSAKSGGKAEAR